MGLQRILLDQRGVFQSFFDYHPDGIILMDIDGRFIDANASALNEKLLEFPLNQLMNSAADKGEFRKRIAIQHKKGHLIYI